MVGSLFGVERAISDMLATTREGCVLETGYNSLTSVLQAKLSSGQTIGSDIARMFDLMITQRVSGPQRSQVH